MNSPDFIQWVYWVNLQILSKSCSVICSGQEWWIPLEKSGALLQSLSSVPFCNVYFTLFNLNIILFNKTETCYPLIITPCISAMGHFLVFVSNFIFLTTALLRYNSPTIIIYLFKVYISVAFSIFIEFCNCHHYLILEYFCHPEKKRCAVISHSLPNYLPNSRQPLIYFLSL